MERLYRAADLPEAHLLRDLLEEDGLHACIVNESLSSLAGEMPFGLVTPEVWIPDSRDLFLARAVLREFLERKQTPILGERRCDACGEESPENFAVCWSCRRPF
jgi:hypothetical protein